MDQYADTPLPLAAAAAAKERATLLERLGAIEAGLARIAPLVERLEVEQPQRGGMGHNQPPEPLPIDTVQIHLGISAANVWRNELSAEHQRPDVVRLSYLGLKHVAKGIVALGRWLAGKGDEFCEALVKSAGNTAGKVIVGAAALKVLLEGLGTDLAEVLIALERWAQAHGLL